jgi:DNA-binding NarL/FixJ family response regulator
MCTHLCIQVLSPLDGQKTDLDFYFPEAGEGDHAKLVLQRLVDVIAQVHHPSQYLRLNLEMDVEDKGEAIFLLRKALQSASCKPDRIKKLSVRESEVMELIMQGHTNQQIAKKLNIGFETVRSHRKHILTKTGMPNAASLIHYYHQSIIVNCMNQ